MGKARSMNIDEKGVQNLNTFSGALIPKIRGKYSPTTNDRRRMAKEERLIQKMLKSDVVDGIWCATPGWWNRGVANKKIIAEAT